MDNKILCRLIHEALQSVEQAEKLASAIEYIPEIKRYLHKDLQPYYERALPATEKDVKRNINKFPQMKKLNLETTNCDNSNDAANIRKRFVDWVLIILKADCKDVIRGRSQPVSMSDPIGNEGITIEDAIADDLSLTGIQLILNQELLSIGRQMKQYIEEDIERKLRNCHPRNRPDVDCQTLSQKLLFTEPPLNRREVARELKVPEQTVYDRWKKYCRPLLQRIAIELGYEN